MKNEIIVKPLEAYTPPNLPTLEESRKNPDFLKKLPLRWRKKAAVIAAAGIMGAWAFASPASATELSTADALAVLRASVGLSELTEEQTARFGISGIPSSADALRLLRISVGLEKEPEAEEDLETADVDIYIPAISISRETERRLHGGGAPPMAFYVVHLTEQEALGIIRDRLEEAGLSFGCELPDIFADVERQDSLGRTYRLRSELQLYDSSNYVVVALGNRWSADRVMSEFALRNECMFFTIFLNPSMSTQIWSSSPSDEVLKAEENRVRATLEESLNRQINEFIRRLRAEGII
jgi:hypothetical protein